LNCVSQSEREEFENEFKQQYEREKVLLTEENKKLTSELDKVSGWISFGQVCAGCEALWFIP
jgi:hypothetical protein